LRNVWLLRVRSAKRSEAERKRRRVLLTEPDGYTKVVYKESPCLFLEMRSGIERANPRCLLLQFVHYNACANWQGHHVL
jgi:hypothetical protein